MGKKIRHFIYKKPIIFYFCLIVLIFIETELIYNVA